VTGSNGSMAWLAGHLGISYFLTLSVFAGESELM
jgi:hypothetical protein